MIPLKISLDPHSECIVWSDLLLCTMNAACRFSSLSLSRPALYELKIRSALEPLQAKFQVPNGIFHVAHDTTRPTPFEHQSSTIFFLLGMGEGEERVRIKGSSLTSNLFPTRALSTIVPKERGTSQWVNTSWKGLLGVKSGFEKQKGRNQEKPPEVWILPLWLSQDLSCSLILIYCWFLGRNKTFCCCRETKLAIAS